MSAQHTALREELNGLYVDNQGWLRSWLNQKVGCSYKAADLTHDTFLRLLIRDELIQAQEPRAYLKVVAKRVLFDHWRREQVEKAYLEALAQIPQEAVPPADRRLMLLETLIEVDRLLDGLPIPVKRAFLYAQLDGLKQKEIAAALNISVSTVKRYLIQAGMQCYFANRELA